MTALYLYDDGRARMFEPFASTRPVSELVAGTVRIRDRWKAAAQTSGDVYFLAGERHTDFDDGSETRLARGVIPAGSIVANARCAPDFPVDIPEAAERAGGVSRWMSAGRLAAVRLTRDVDADAFGDGALTLESLTSDEPGDAPANTATVDVGGVWHDEVWDLVRHLQPLMAMDIERYAGQPYVHAAPVPAHVTVLGAFRVLIVGDVVIEPHVVLDATLGPIMIREGTHIRAFSRITGPCFLGAHVTIMGGDVSGCSIGDWCKVRGEISSTVILGYSNKGHDGFVGHSYLGAWVNLGAGTITSNLKNTYGSVALWTPDGVRDTGMQFLGTLFGDHVKTGIGLRLTTGTVLGAGAMVYDNMPPKSVAPFAWGGGAPYAVYRADKFLEAAGRMMARRHVELSDSARRHLTLAHERRWTDDSASAEPSA